MTIDASRDGTTQVGIYTDQNLNYIISDLRAFRDFDSIQYPVIKVSETFSDTETNPVLWTYELDPNMEQVLVRNNGFEFTES